MVVPANHIFFEILLNEVFITADKSKFSVLMYKISCQSAWLVVCKN